MSFADPEAAIYSYLSGLTTVNGAVGGATNPRIYPGQAPQDDDYPRITFTLISDKPDHHMQGASGLTDAMVQIDVWALSSVSRRAVTTLVKNAMDGIVGALMGTMPNAINVDSVFLHDRVPTKEKATNASEEDIYRMRMEFKMWYREAIPTLS